jgi:hypothetical protein
MFEMGLFNEAYLFSTMAFEIDPYDINNLKKLALSKAFLNDFKGCNDVLNFANEVNLNLDGEWFLLKSIALAHLDSLNSLNHIMSDIPDEFMRNEPEYLYIPQALAMMSQDKVKESFRLLKQWRENEHFHIAIQFMPGIWAKAGLRDRAYQIINTTYQVYGIMAYEWFLIDPLLENLRNDVKFMGVVSELKTKYENNKLWYENRDFDWTEEDITIASSK